ncbi:RAD50-interacting protein 1-like [Artemia franciscana]|uniref:RAD50-interacting protein 1-like n=1 Tax=Artemia franciscana TaxID=6661 RepID=UPI0032DA43F1
MVKFMVNVRGLKQEWAKTIYLSVKRSVEDVLVEIGWPFISTNQPLENVKRITDDGYKKFQSPLKILALLNNEVNPDSDSIWELPFSISGLSLSMRHLTKPLKKRFEYHFSGNRQTNDLSRPELYLTQVLDWCKRPCTFLSEWVQPLFDSSNIDSKEEFTRALYGLVVVKLSHDLPLLYEDDYLFGHCIDEIIVFERELRLSVQNHPSVHETLTGECTLEKWLRTEKKYAIEKMDTLLSSDTAWLSNSDVEFDGATVLYVTEVAEKFTKTLLAMTDRYNVLPQVEHRLQFLDLQLQLLE